MTTPTALYETCPATTATVREALRNAAPAAPLSRRAAAPLATPEQRRKLIAFGWYGGKFSHLNWLLPHLPTDALSYCEPFGGSAAVLLNREPAQIETYNDLDGEVVNFFRVLREQGDALVAALELTPYSREEYGLACGSVAGVNDLERARRFYIRARQTRSGLAQTASLGRWSQVAGSSRRNMANVVSRWHGGLAQLPLIVDRLTRVQIENRPALDLIRMYDSEETLFYVDPPYVPASRTAKTAYGFELSIGDHENLAVALRAVRGKVALSGYRCEFMNDTFADWRRIDGPEKQLPSSRARVQREALWLNFK